MTGAAGSVRHALEQHLGGAWQEAEPCSVNDEHGYEGVPEGEYEEDEASRLREEVEMLKVARIVGYQDSGKTRLIRAPAWRWQQ